jgi:tryptophan synthase alpha chain
MKISLFVFPAEATKTRQQLRGIEGEKFMSNQVSQKIKIGNTFQNGKAFIAFVTGGDPSIEKTKEFIFEMVRAGADIIEIGIPFSDPIAEGPVIQEANIRALNAGTTVEKLFNMIKELREEDNVSIPLVFLTYVNPVFRYGYEKFFKRASEVGLNGIIIPDLPFEEQASVKEIASKYEVDVISLIAPTSEKRIQQIAQNASGFIYLVSSMGVTGTRSEITTDIFSIVQTIKSVTDVPVAVGFGIHSSEQAAKISKIADGVIVGSAIVKLIAEHGENANAFIFDYVKKMKGAISG